MFLSYSSKDVSWAEAICKKLESQGIRCWIAPRDISPGTEWGAAIIEGMDCCRVMVLIFSGNANASPQVRREVERAISKGMAILPVRVENVAPDGALEYALGNTHWLDAYVPPVDQRLQQLFEATASLLGTAVEPTPVRSSSSSTIIPWAWIIGTVCAVTLVAILAFSGWGYFSRPPAFASSVEQSVATEPTPPEPVDSPDTTKLTVQDVEYELVGLKARGGGCALQFAVTSRAGDKRANLNVPQAANLYTADGREFVVRLVRGRKSAEADATLLDGVRVLKELECPKLPLDIREFTTISLSRGTRMGGPIVFKGRFPIEGR